MDAGLPGQGQSAHLRHAPRIDLAEGLVRQADANLVPTWIIGNRKQVFGKEVAGVQIGWKPHPDWAAARYRAISHARWAPCAKAKVTVSAPVRHSRIVTNQPCLRRVAAPPQGKPEKYPNPERADTGRGDGR